MYGVFIGIILLGLFVMGFWTRLAAVVHPKRLWHNRSLVYNCMIAVSAAAVTYWLNIHAGLGPLIASGLMGLIAGFALKPDQTKLAYAAIFIGMSGAEVTNWLTVIAAGLLMSVVYELAREQCAGVGGRLGTLAACVGIMAVWLLS